ncbi:MAG: ADP-ribosylglycohydrolase family protein [Candidatus Hodarchaeales archaeon]
MEQKIWGCLFGSALGDALGAPVEFKSLETIIRHYGAGGIQDPPNNALWTDDTEMMIALAKGLLPVLTEESLEVIMQSVTREYIAWLDHPGIAPGNTCMRGANALKQGIHWTESGVRESKGCGSAMRSGIVGLLYHDSPAKLREVASASGLATHGHPAADAACIAAALLVSFAVKGVDTSEYPRKLLNEVGGISTEFDEIISETEKLVNEAVPPGQALPSLGRGWTGDEAVAMAMYCIMTNPGDYVKAVRQAVNITGDSDSIGCITGGILGAKLGFQALPGEWVERLAEKPRLTELGNEIIATLVTPRKDRN